MTRLVRLSVRRTLAATTVAVVGLGLAVATSPAAVAAPAVPAARSAVVSGNARFEVLSPTLIRTEYAGDSAFLDAATFNAVGRDGFTRTSFTSKVVGGG